MNRFEHATRSRPTGGGRRISPVTASALASLVTGWTVLALWLVVEGPGDYPWRDAVLYPALMFGSAIAVLMRGIVAGADRRAWLLFGLAMLVSAGGDLAYVVATVQHHSQAFPSMADAMYLAYYPLCLAGVSSFIRRRVQDVPGVVWQDAAVLTLAVGGLVGAVFLVPLAGTIEGGIGAEVVGAAYPVGDTVVVLAAAVGIAVVGVRRAHALLWIAGGVVFAGMADLAYWNLAALGSYQDGTSIDALWPLSNLFMALGAWLPRPVRYAALGATRGLMVVPGATLVAATATLVIGTFQRVPLVVTAVAVAALLGVLNRLNATARATLAMINARRDAATDELTGLANRRGFVLASEALIRDTGTDRGAALLLADLDGFKEVNDSLGHDAGDQVLKEVTARLLATVDVPGAVIGRLGGDEFAVMVPGLHSAESLARQLAAALSHPLPIEGTWVPMNASIGIARTPGDGGDLSTLLRRADIAMYRAKSERSGIAVFDAGLDVGGEDRLQRIAQLRTGIAAGQLELHYQPKIALNGGCVEGVEALVRWNVPGRGLVYPDRFLPLATRAGLMGELTAAVLDMAASQAALWRSKGIMLPIAVNLPVTALIDSSFPDSFARLLAAHGLPGEALQVEITEEALLHDRVRAQAVLTELRSLGVRAAIDDYGTGYSSLVYLHELVVDEVKIDRSFVVPMLSNERSASIVRSTIELAHVLGLRVVAEGIEEDEVAMRLAQFGCDAAQGYYWSRPLPADELAEWLRSNQLPCARAKDRQHSGAA